MTIADKIRTLMTRPPDERPIDAMHRHEDLLAELARYDVYEVDPHREATDSASVWSVSGPANNGGVSMGRLLAIGILFIGSTVAWADGGVGPALQATSVNIKAQGQYGGGAQGSGTVVLRDVDGQQTAFVITAAHVIDGLRSVREAIVGGDKKQMIEYRDAQIVQEVSTPSGARIVGDTRLDARVVCVDYSRDIAVLQVRSLGTLKASAKFFAGKEIPPAGTEILHCGSPGGQDTGGTATLTNGIVSRTGVRLPDFGGGSDKGIFDQTDTAAMGGSSGGMVCLRTSGEWIGMITLGLRGGDSFHWFVPIRNVRAFSTDAKCEWLLNGGKVTQKQVDELPIEVTPPVKSSSVSSDKPQTEPAVWTRPTAIEPL